MNPADLVEIEAIKQLKYRYMRCLDLKLWDEMTDLFTEDATCSYSGGRYAYSGRDAILKFFRDSMGPEMITAHHVHHPEITITSATTARGTWALEDTVIHTQHDFTLRGAAFYEDVYTRETPTSHWRIHHTGYERLYEEIQPRKDTPNLQLTQNRWAKED